MVFEALAQVAQEINILGTGLVIAVLGGIIAVVRAIEKDDKELQAVLIFTLTFAAGVVAKGTKLGMESSVLFAVSGIMVLMWMAKYFWLEKDKGSGKMILNIGTKKE